MWQKIINNNYYIALFLSSVFLVAFTITYFGLLAYVKASSKTLPIKTFQENETDTNTNFEPINADESYNIVLLGSGGEGHSGGTLTDSIIIVSIDKQSKKATLITVPRDLWVPGNYKINAAVNNVGLNNIKSTLQNVTGLKIKKYASVDFSGIIKLIDNLGGVEVDIPKTFDDNFYPVRGLENETCGKSPAEIASLHQKYSGFNLEKQFTCRYEHLHFDKGKASVDGETALKIARSRHGDSDFGRSARQVAILKGIFSKLLSTGSFEKIGETFKNMAGIVATDLSVSEATELSKVFGPPSEYKINEIYLNTSNVLNESKSSDGQYILIPKTGVNNFSGLRNFILGQ